MDAAAREALGRLVGGADTELLGDARRVRELLQDTCPQSRREVMVLVAAVEEGLPLRLRRLTAGGMGPGELGRLATELTRTRGLDPVMASWAVGAWAWALGVGPIPAQEQVPAGAPERTPVQGQAGLRPPQRPPASPPTPGVTEERESPKRPRTVPFAAAIAAGVLLVGGIVLFTRPESPRPTPSTPSAGPTTTSAPQQPPARVVLFREDFSDKSNVWDAGNLSAGWIRYAQGAYLFHGTKPDTMMGHPRTFNPMEANARLGIEVSGRRSAGARDAGYGIFCRFTGDWRDLRTQSFYELEVRDSGSFVIQKFVHGAYHALQVSGPKASAIRTGQVNHLQGECTGGQNGQPVTLSLWANDQLLARVSDRSEPLPATGEVGLLASTYDNPPVDVVFDDFVVYAA